MNDPIQQEIEAKGLTAPRVTPADQKVAVWVNNEDRMMLTIANADGSQTESVAVEDKLIPWPVKPPAQRVAAEGFDAHKGMGSR